ncbi:MAG: hypothetical protein KC800_19385 [Candidatus Eremiobacteraeota bacterium]|nr:hypothetical protein [Candidatus Eremiobacteraeota bacterium]
MKISNPSLQQRQQVFMNTFSSTLNEDEENRIYEQAFDTFSQQSESGGASFEKMPSLLAAHTFVTAKTSLSALMPTADLTEIRAAAGERPEVAKWVNLLDTSSEFLEAATEQPISSPPSPPANPQSVSPAPTVIYSEPPQVSTDDGKLAEAVSKVERALSLSQEASSNYSSAAQNSNDAGRNMREAGGALSDRSSRSSSAGAALGLGRSAEASGQSAKSASDSANDKSAETERLIESARYLIADDRVADRLDDLVNLCNRAQAKGQEGESEIWDAASSLRAAMSGAQHIADSPKDAQLALDAIDASSEAYDSESAYSHSAYDFEDAGREQNLVTSGLQEVLAGLRDEKSSQRR